ncbi:MAG: PD-(D/E)XK motif protein [Rhodoferax sp.]
MTRLTDAYQRVRDELADLGVDGDEKAHRTIWIVPRVLGVARSDKSIDVFLVGELLHAKSALVRRHLDYAKWDVAGEGASVEANRVAYPGKDQYVPVAAMVAVELAHAGIEAGESIHSAFSRVEAVIELSLRRSLLTEEHLLGLLGELACLDVMLSAVGLQPQLLVSVLEMWTGWRGATRDFRIGSTSVEVKATLAASSSHRFSGLYQVERAPDESRLLLLSVGFHSDTGDGISLSSMVSRIAKLLRLSGVEGLEPRFLDAVKSYGIEHGIGYDHASMADHHVYATKFSMTFTPRLYDMDDVNMRLLRRTDVEMTFVRADDLAFSLELPSSIAPGNPLANWAHAITQFTRESLHLT